jgi:RecB family exonuclease
LGVGRPKGYPLALNSAVDTLLKKEFDLHRAKNKAHPLMAKYKIDAVPFQHDKMDEWRDSLRRGVTFLHQRTNFLITGGIDDLWVNPAGALHVVDYKATAKDGEIGIDADWQIGYKRQMEIYQWLLRRNGFQVSETGYFVYCNGRTDRKAFDGKLEFDVEILPYHGNDDWVEEVIVEIYDCLRADQAPAAAADCDYCRYRAAVEQVTN